jgi:hypothetical protein
MYHTYFSKQKQKKRICFYKKDLVIQANNNPKASDLKIIMCSGFRFPELV